MANHLQKRLMKDIAELQREPYPRIALHTRAVDDLEKACLMIQPEGWMPIHMTVEFGERYPVVAPRIRMNTKMHHPNVFDSYICASILNTHEGYTPAYTLKGIAIQMLSFFNSDAVEQIYTDKRYSLKQYREFSSTMKQSFVCAHCGFDGAKTKAEIRKARRYASKTQPSSEEPQSNALQERRQQCGLANFPDELLLATLDELGFEDLIAFSKAWQRVEEIVAAYDLIRLRELQCFFSKENFQKTKLGVGVNVSSKGRRSIESEFDLISQTAFRDLAIRRSVHNIPFRYWLPLPLSRRHWESVKGDAAPVLTALSREAGLLSKSPVEVLASFMNDIVVRLNMIEAQPSSQELHHNFLYHNQTKARQKSTLRHASEKAIESYFHLFHLLLCLATENEHLVSAANSKITGFMNGQTSKTACPNLGHLLVYLLISDIPITDMVRKTIITEAITRNVVWMLDKRGANMPELSYLEPDKVSHYRLRKTFEASRTSYRLLMFSELFRRIARPFIDNESLVQIRDELFDRHGAPPTGAALHLSTEVRRLHDIDNFWDFFVEMGIEQKPGIEWFTNHLRQCVNNSMNMGYSVWGVSESTALALRQDCEPTVGVYVSAYEGYEPLEELRRATFFPNKKPAQRRTFRRR